MLAGARLMQMDDRRLLELRRYEDVEAGVSERFLDLRLGPAESFGILTEPLTGGRGRAWVIAPSVGPEHGNLRRLETLVARSLAAAGFPVLRIRPDLHPAHGAIGEIDLATRMAELDAAVGAVVDETGSDDVGFVGALFGGASAALAAERTGAPALAVIEPVTRGRQYLREIMRRQAVAEVVGVGAESDSRSPSAQGESAHGESHQRQSAVDELERVGETSVRGLRLTKEGFDAVSAVSLDETLATFSGSSLVVGISPSGEPSPRLRKLHERLLELGGDTRLEIVQDELVAPFGEYYYRNVGPVRIDTRLALDELLAGLLAGWARDLRVAEARA